MATTPLTHFTLSAEHIVPFELPDNELADTIFEVQWAGKTVTVCAKRVRTPLDSKTDWLFFWSQENPVLCMVKGRITHTTMYTHQIRNLVQESLAEKQWMFAYFVDAREWGGAGLFWLCLAADERRGYWCALDSFLWYQTFEVEEHYVDLGEALADSTSNVRSVLAWGQLSPIAHSFSSGELWDVTPLELAYPGYSVAGPNQIPRCPRFGFEAQVEGRIVPVAVELQSAGDDARFVVLRFRCANEPFSRSIIQKVSIGGTGLSCELASRVVNEAIAREEWGWSYKIQPEGADAGSESWIFVENDQKSGRCWKKTGSPVDASRFFVESTSSLKDDILNPHSDIRFALAWQQLTPDEKFQISTVFARGNFQEFREVLCAVARVERLGQKLSHIFYATDIGRFVSYQGARTASSAGPTTTSSVLKWTNYIHNYFRISVNEELARKHRCISFEYPDHSFKPPWISLPLSPPSQHEYLEAALFLQKWGTGKIPPDELRLHLPKL